MALVFSMKNVVKKETSVQGVMDTIEKAIAEGNKGEQVEVKETVAKPLIKSLEQAIAYEKGDKTKARSTEMELTYSLPACMYNPTGKSIGLRTYTEFFNQLLNKDPNEAQIEWFNHWISWYEDHFGHPMVSEKLVYSFIQSNYMVPPPETSEEKKKRKSRKSVMQEELEAIDNSAEVIASIEPAEVTEVLDEE